MGAGKSIEGCCGEERVSNYGVGLHGHILCVLFGLWSWANLTVQHNKTERHILATQFQQQNSLRTSLKRLLGCIIIIIIIIIILPEKYTKSHPLVWSKQVFCPSLQRPHRTIDEHDTNRRLNKTKLVNT